MLRQIIALSPFISYVLAKNRDIFSRQAVTSFSPSQTSACLNIVGSCFPTAASCTASFCSQCASIAGPDFVSCCDGSNAAACISTVLSEVSKSVSAGTATATAGFGSSPASITNDANAATCSSALDIYSSCAAQTSGFFGLDDGHQASCLCYTASDSVTLYAPENFDSAWDGCIAYASTSDTADYAAYSSAVGLCTKVGNILGLASVSATATSDGSYASSTAGGVALGSRTGHSTSSQTQNLIASASTGGAIAAMPEAVTKYSQSWGYLLLGLGWLI